MRCGSAKKKEDRVECTHPTGDDIGEVQWVIVDESRCKWERMRHHNRTAAHKMNVPMRLK